MNNIVITGLNLISGLLTAVGLSTLLHRQLHAYVGEQFALILAIVLGGIISLIVQALIRTLWRDIAARGIAIGLLVVALTVSAISGFGAAASFSMAASAADIQVFKQRSAGAQVSQPIRNFADGFSNMRAQLLTLSGDASSLAADETRGLVTCTNDQSNRRNCGPKCRLRQRHAAALSQADEDASALERDARDLAVRFASTDNAETQQTLFAEAAVLRGNTKQPQIAATLRSLAQELRAPATDPDTGRTVDCRDERFAQSLTGMADLISTRIDLPLLAPQSQTAGLDDAAICVAKRVGELTGLSSACEAPVADWPIFAALLLEVLLVLLIFARVKRMKDLGVLSSPIEEFMAAAQERSPQEQSFLSRLVAGLDTYVWDSGLDGKFLVVPLDGPVECCQQANHLVRVLNTPEPEYLGVQMCDIAPAWLSARESIFGDAQHFNLHRLPVDTHDLVRRAERDLS